MLYILMINFSLGDIKVSFWHEIRCGCYGDILSLYHLRFYGSNSAVPGTYLQNDWENMGSIYVSSLDQTILCLVSN